MGILKRLKLYTTESEFLIGKPTLEHHWSAYVVESDKMHYCEASVTATTWDLELEYEANVPYSATSSIITWTLVQVQHYSDGDTSRIFNNSGTTAVTYTVNTSTTEIKTNSGIITESAFGIEGSEVTKIWTIVQEVSPVFYTIKFVDDDDTVIDEKQYLEGETVVIPDNPTKEDHVFAGWSPEVVSEVEGDATYKATYNYIFIDLGLPSGNLWCALNLGAYKYTKVGKYFQWGDTVGYEGDEAKNHSTWSTAPFNNGEATFNKEHFSTISASVIENGELIAAYDAAAAVSPKWRIPSCNDYYELLENTEYGVSSIGIFLRSKSLQTYTGIMIPFSGYMEDGEQKNADKGYLMCRDGMLTFLDNGEIKVLEFAKSEAGEKAWDEPALSMACALPIIPIKPKEPELEYVDLGLPSGLLWAKCNVGAEKETDAGKYFQWGDTVGYEGDEAKSHSGWDTCPFNGGSMTYDASYFATVSASVCFTRTLEMEYDAVNVNKGDNWRMPTKSDFYELTRLTQKEWTTIEGVNGYKFYKQEDPSNYVFFPASGHYLWGTQYALGYAGYYASSELYDYSDEDFYCMWFDRDGLVNYQGNLGRATAVNIRGVKPKSS